MSRTARFAAALALPATLAAVAALAQPAKDERDLGKRGAMSREQLRREPITFELDVPYAETRNPRHRLDIYLPKLPKLPKPPEQRKTDKLPVIVFFHGGGWVQGDKSDGAGRLMPLVRTGRYAGISVGYRLAGEVPWPAQIHDGKAAIRWIRANAGRYGLDADRIGVWGRSAGAHLALMLGVSNGVPELEGNLGSHTAVSSRVAAVASFFGVTDLLALIGKPSALDRTKPDAPEALLIGGSLLENPARAAAASPLAYVSANDAPVLIVHGTADRTVPYDQAVRLDTALRQAGVPSYFVTVQGGGHGDFGTAADGRVEAFFTRYLRGEDAAVSTAPIKLGKERRE
jgi:acetyl esterase/lipase